MKGRKEGGTIASGWRKRCRPLIACRDVMLLDIGEIMTNHGLPCSDDSQDDGAERASRSPSAGRTKRASSYELQEDQRTPNGSLRRAQSLARSARGSNPDLEENSMLVIH
jgi:hypothetical protein